MLLSRNKDETFWNCIHLLTQQSVVWWRRLGDVFCLCLQKRTSSRRLDQGEYVRLSLTSSEDVLVKTNIFVLAIRLQDVLPRCLQDVFKTSSRRLAKASSRHLQDVFKASLGRLAKTSSRRLQNFFKTSCKTFPRNPQDLFKMF